MSDHPQRLFSSPLDGGYEGKWRRLSLPAACQISFTVNKSASSDSTQKAQIQHIKKLKWLHLKEHLASSTSRLWWSAAEKTKELNQPEAPPRDRSLTILDVVEDDELLPAQLLHQSQHDVVEADGRPGGQRVALPAGARVELAGGPRRSLAVPLDVQVRDVHGVRQGLQRAGRRAARRRDQRQNALVHQLAGCRRKKKKRDFD